MSTCSARLRSRPACVHGRPALIRWRRRRVCSSPTATGCGATTSAGGSCGSKRRTLQCLIGLASSASIGPPLPSSCLPLAHLGVSNEFCRSRSTLVSGGEHPVDLGDAVELSRCVELGDRGSRRGARHRVARSTFRSSLPATSTPDRSSARLWPVVGDGSERAACLPSARAWAHVRGGCVDASRRAAATARGGCVAVAEYWWVKRLAGALGVDHRAVSGASRRFVGPVAAGVLRSTVAGCHLAECCTGFDSAWRVWRGYWAARRSSCATGCASVASGRRSTTTIQPPASCRARPIGSGCRSIVAG